MGWMSSLFQSKNQTKYDLTDLGVDMHSHLIPGIDDGSKSMDQTIDMLLKFRALGYKKVITTPHIMSDLYKNTPEIINNGLQKVHEALANRSIDIEIEAAAEYFTDSYFIDLINERRLLTFGKNNVLFEFSFAAKPIQADETIFALKTNGYQPILAHFERYSFFFNDGVAIAKDLRKRGVDIQLNLISLTGHYGPSVKKQAERLIDYQLVDYVATDCHKIEHLQLLERSLSHAYFKKLKSLTLKNRNL